MKGAEPIASELVRLAIGLAFRRHCESEEFTPVVSWFERGGYLKLPDPTSTTEALQALQRIDGLIARVRTLGRGTNLSPAETVAAAEFILEGLAANSKISRSQERGFAASAERRPEVGREAAEPTRDPGRRRVN